MSDALRRLPLACPIDGLALVASGRAFACERGHAYDVSRQGYVNLLPVQFKPSKDPGDGAAMVAARRRVLDAGLFDPLADAVAAAVADTVATATVAADGTLAPVAGTRATSTLVDAGCGEGFYTARIARRLRADDACGDVRVLGTDISVHAVKSAAGRHRDIGWAVANNTRLPVVAGAVDIVASLFGFETWVPWATLQRSGQHVVVAHAGPRHLVELREAIYADVRVHDAPPDTAALAAGYAPVDERRVGFEAGGVSGALLADVLAMTPHGHRVPRDAVDAWTAFLERADGGDAALTMDVVLRRFRRT